MDRLFKQKEKTDYLLYMDLIAKRIQELRKERSESLKRVGKAVGIPAAKLRKIENGLFNFSSRKLFRLCHYYGVSLSYIYRYNELVIEDLPCGVCSYYLCPITL